MCVFVTILVVNVGTDTITVRAIITITVIVSILTKIMIITVPIIIATIIAIITNGCYCYDDGDDNAVLYYCYY